MRTDEVGPEGHEGRDTRPCNVYLDLRDLDIVLACTLEDLHGHVKDLRTDVVRHV